MDQPYTRRCARCSRSSTSRPDDPSPYDDTGWTLDELRHVQTLKIADSTMLTAADAAAPADATVAGSHHRQRRRAPRAAPRRLALGGAAVEGRAAPRCRVADTAFTRERHEVRPRHVHRGERRRRDARCRERARTRARRRSPRRPRASPRRDRAPRIALMHSWIETQNEGWVRYAFDQMGVPYTYIADQKLVRAGHARQVTTSWCFPHVNGAATTIVNGRPMVGPAIPWKKTALTPNLGKMGPDRRHAPRDGIRGPRGAARVRGARRPARDGRQQLARADRVRSRADGERGAAAAAPRPWWRVSRAARDGGRAPSRTATSARASRSTSTRHRC